MHLGGPEVVLILVLVAVFAVVPIWALVDLAGRPAEAFDVVGQSRPVWVLLLVLGLLLCQLLGLVAGLYYLFDVRPKLSAAAPGS